MNSKDIKRKDRKFYFGFGSQMDYPEWQNGLETSLWKDSCPTPERAYQSNPFKPRLRRLLKDHEDNIEFQNTFHNITVERGEQIRPLVYDITRKLIAAGWEVGDFNRNMAVDDIWEEYLEDKKEETL